MVKTGFDLYSWNTPNGQKIIIALEEAGVEYRYHAIDIRNGEQHTGAFRALSPDGKIPALVCGGDAPITLFESGAILFHLAVLYPTLTGGTSLERALASSWTFWQVGQLGPLIGQFGRFSGADVRNLGAIDHFEKLVWRCLDVMETRLRESAFLAGDTFTIADIACIPWIASKQSYLNIFDVPWRERCPAINLWATALLDKPSVKTALQ